MSFFDLENELPRWLDDVIKEYPSFKEIECKECIYNLDRMSKESYHLLCADKGNMKSDKQQYHHIWKFQPTKKKMQTYGKYLEYNDVNNPLKFWIGYVEIDDTKDFFIWTNKKLTDIIGEPSKSVALLKEEQDKYKYGYWYNFDKEKNYFDYGNDPLDEKELKELENKVKEKIRSLLNAVVNATVPIALT